MLKFGKKVNYRPIGISFIYGFFIGSFAGDFTKSWFWGIGIGLLMFLAVIFIYYFPNVPTLFIYWTADKDKIQYCDVNDRKNRLLAIFVPSAAHMTTIKKSDIKSATIIGDLKDTYDVPMAIPYTPAVGVFGPAMSMIHQPEAVRLNLKDGQVVDLSVARDYAYSRNNTLDKLEKFFKGLGDIPVNVKVPSDRRNHQTIAQ